MPSQHVDGSNPKHKRFISIPHTLVLLCDVVILVAAVRVWVHVKHSPRTACMTREWRAVRPPCVGEIASRRAQNLDWHATISVVTTRPFLPLRAAMRCER